MDKRAFTFEMSSELFEKISELAKQTELTNSAFIRLLLTEYVRQIESNSENDKKAIFTGIKSNV